MKQKHMLKVGMAAVILIAFYFLIPVSAQESDAGAVIDKVMDAYGGRQNILSVNAYRMEAVIQTHVRVEKGMVIRVFEGMERLKVIIRYRDSMEFRLLDGEKALRGTSPDKLTFVQGPLRDSMALQASRAGIPWIFEKMKKETRLIKSANGNLPVLEVSLGKGMFLKAFVDEKTYFITRTEMVSTEGEMKLDFAVDFSDFRKEGGVVFPFKEENYASGSHTATTTVNKILLNPTGEELGLLYLK